MQDADDARANRYPQIEIWVTRDIAFQEILTLNDLQDIALFPLFCRFGAKSILLNPWVP